MLRNIKDVFYIKKKGIEDEIILKSKTEKIVSKFVKEEIIKNSGLDFNLSYTFNKGIIKIETGNKLIAQEIALRIRSIEERLRDEGVNFRKLLI